MDLIVPARNEAANVPALFDALHAADARPRLRRIVVADNGSTDATADLARQRGAEVVHESTPGYGGACLAAIAHLADDPPEAVAFLDADLSDDPAALAGLIEAVCVQGFDLAVGSRVALAEAGALEPHQRFGNALACRLIALATGRRFRDLAPMRVVRFDALRRLDMRDRTWGWIVEMNYKAATHGLRVVERDVPYRRRHAGVSKISGSLQGSWRAGTKILSTIYLLWRAERQAAARQAKHARNA